MGPSRLNGSARRFAPESDLTVSRVQNVAMCHDPTCAPSLRQLVE